MIITLIVVPVLVLVVGVFAALMIAGCYGFARYIIANIWWALAPKSYLLVSEHLELARLAHGEWEGNEWARDKAAHRATFLAQFKETNDRYLQQAADKARLAELRSK